MIPASPTFITAPAIQMAGDPLELFLRVNAIALGFFVVICLLVVWIADDREGGQ